MWLLQIIVLAIVISAAIAGVSAAPWLPTKPRDRAHLLNHLKLTPGQKVVDLGCGDGSMLFAVARKFPEVVCVGYDISLLPLFFGWARKLLYFKKYRHVHIRFGNLFKQSVEDADLVFIFLLSKSYPKLVELLKRDIKDEAQVVVEAWPFPNTTPLKTLKEDKLLSIFLYTGKSLRHVE
ncbi:MAG: methyltransferase [Patescibacteria group bacterium]|jgi:precorrin-6B methylase 2